MVSLALEKVRREGIWSLLRGIVRTGSRELDHRRWLRFERRAGIDSEGKIPGSELGVPWIGYEAIRRWMFARLFERVHIDPKEFTFVDLGSGKGRALLLASEYGFRCVIGVELSESLHEAAVANVEHYLAKTGRPNVFDVRLADAADFRLPDGPVVLFFFNPFDAPILDLVAAEIERSYHETARPIVVLYWTPRLPESFDRSDVLAPVEITPYFRVYSAAPVPAMAAAAT